MVYRIQALSLRSSAGSQCSAIDQGVDGDSQEEDGAEEREVPGAVPAGVDHALEGHADDAGAKRGANGRAIAAGEEASADDGGDDVEELVADPLLGHGRTGLRERDDP